MISLLQRSGVDEKTTRAGDQSDYGSLSLGVTEFGRLDLLTWLVLLHTLSGCISWDHPFL